MPDSPKDFGENHVFFKMLTFSPSNIFFICRFKENSRCF